MRLTDILDKLNRHLEDNGDTEVLSWKIVDETGGHEWFMYSKTKVDPFTRRKRKMTSREFMQHLNARKPKQDDELTKSET